ncbi:5'-3' exonuclease [Pseudomaricurvus sp.]|uniref:5'-3' exonuclease n=1 Tax=Pseudomaricurvus sp. TaxID=2004510 RepID=UPI003F6AE7D2
MTSSTHASFSGHESSSDICLLDASIYIFRYYFSLPDNWFSQEGYPTAAVYGYTAFLLNFLTRQRPSLMAACFDESLGSCFRNELYPDYKCSRALPDEALAFQLNACREVTELLGIASFASDTYEADDLLGTLLEDIKRSGDERGVAILTRDKDLGQLLLRPQDCLWDYVNENQHQRLYREDIFQKFGVWPEQLSDYLALVGDTSDDIPGVPGIGQKTAQVLLQWQPSIEALFEHIEELPKLPIRGAKGLPEKLVDHTEQIVLSRCLADIVTDIDWQTEGGTPSSLSVSLDHTTTAAFEDFCLRMGFGSGLMKKYAQMVAVDEPVESEVMDVL